MYPLSLETRGERRGLPPPPRACGVTVQSPCSKKQIPSQLLGPWQGRSEGWAGGCRGAVQNQPAVLETPLLPTATCISFLSLSSPTQHCPRSVCPSAGAVAGGEQFGKLPLLWLRPG